MVRPGGFELPAFWFVAIRVKMLNALFGVAYGLETPFFPQLAAPNPAPKTELYRTCTDQLTSSIRKAEFGFGEPTSWSRTSIQKSLSHRPGVTYGIQSDQNAPSNSQPSQPAQPSG